MARVTVEDCVDKVPNRFELVLMAAKRAHDIEKGAVPSVARDNDKPTIIALREIAEETISLDALLQATKDSVSGNVEEEKVSVPEVFDLKFDPEDFTEDDEEDEDEDDQEDLEVPDEE